jgi:hypothetical protein
MKIGGYFQFYQTVTLQNISVYVAAIWKREQQRAQLEGPPSEREYPLTEAKEREGLERGETAAREW